MAPIPPATGYFVLVVAVATALLNQVAGGNGNVSLVVAALLVLGAVIVLDPRRRD